MSLNSRIGSFFLRMAAGVAIGLVFGWLLSSLSYAASPIKESAQRGPREVTLVIPYGTAEQVKQGSANPSLPPDMSFVQGDVLVVRNADTVTHRLGPLVILPGTASVLNLDTADRFSYTCSFQPGKTLGLDVQPRVTVDTRFEGALATGLPTGLMLGLYSYMLPGRKKSRLGDPRITPSPGADNPPKG